MSDIQIHSLAYQELMGFIWVGLSTQIKIIKQRYVILTIVLIQKSLSHFFHSIEFFVSYMAPDTKDFFFSILEQ